MIEININNKKIFLYMFFKYAKLMFEKKFVNEKRIIFETENFIVLPNLYPICKGHCMILPKFFIKSYSHLKDYEKKNNKKGLIDEFIKVMTLLGFILERTFNKKFMCIENSGISQSVRSAHLHFVVFREEDSEINFSKLVNNYETQTKKRVLKISSLKLFFDKAFLYDFYTLYINLSQKFILIFDTYDMTKNQIDKLLDYKLISYNTFNYSQSLRDINGKKSEIHVKNREETKFKVIEYLTKNFKYYIENNKGIYLLDINSIELSSKFSF